MAAKLRMKKGDSVIVRTGKDKGKKGEILKMMPKENRALVAGVNMVRRHTRPTQTSPGGIIEKEASMDLSNLAHVDPKDGKPTRVGIKSLKDGRLVRYAKRSGEVIDK